MIELKINNKIIKAKKNSLLIDVSNNNNIYIPNFCYHKKLSISANCRICLVNVNNKLLPACTTKILPNMIVYTNSINIINSRKNIIEFLLINHPLDCPICDKGGECELQDIFIKYGKFSCNFLEKKRIIIKKKISNLISTKEMHRCIHCTRCIRFSEEISGIKELGMINKGDKSEIDIFFKNKIKSEISGNMIDLCPVGALTSKTFRNNFRVWELKKKKTISPHDSFGTNLNVEIKNNKIIRILPFKDKNFNQFWISDKDRFSYLALRNKCRLKQPKIKINNLWNKIKWSKIFIFIIEKINFIINKYNKNSFSILSTAYSTLEEFYLLKKIFKYKNLKNIDFRLRQIDFKIQIYPWLGTYIKKLKKFDNIFIIGSYLNQDHPMLSIYLRKAVKFKTKIIILNSTDINFFISISDKIIISSNLWLLKLKEILKAILILKKNKLPIFLKNITISKQSEKIAKSFLNKKNVFFIGNYCLYHKNLSEIHIVLELISKETKSKLGYLIDGSNMIGGYITKFFSKKKNINTKKIFKNPSNSYILFNSEPDLECNNSKIVKRAFNYTENIINISSYKHNIKYSNILLPITPFTENSGTFINSEGKIQYFNMVNKPFKNSLPGWKILCKLAKFLKLKNFNFKNSKEISNKILKKNNIKKLNNKTNLIIKKKKNKNIKNLFNIELIIKIPTYFSDSVARHSKILLNKKKPIIILSLNLSKKIKILNHQFIKIILKNRKFLLKVKINNNLPNNIMYTSIEYFKNFNLSGIFKKIFIEKI